MWLDYFVTHLTISAGIRTCRCPLEKPSIWTDRLSWIPRCRTRDPAPGWFSLRRRDQREAGNRRMLPYLPICAVDPFGGKAQPQSAGCQGQRPTTVRRRYAGLRRTEALVPGLLARLEFSGPNVVVDGG